MGRADSLIEEVLALVDAGVPWTDALAPVTTVPASILHLGAVGRVQPGGPADVVVLEGKRVWHLVSRGHVLVRDGLSRRLSPFLTSVG